MLDGAVALCAALETQLGIPSGTLRQDILEEALIHASFSSSRNNERLEFLGDSVLRLAAAELLMERYPNATVGELTMMRSHLVSDKVLTDIAETIHLQVYMQISPVAMNDPTGRPKRLADAIEAILATLYLSRGNLQLVRPWLDPFLIPLAEQLRENPVIHNPKSALQELIQKYYKRLPEYRTVEVSVPGEDFPRFEAEVWFDHRCLGKGSGSSRKAAEQAAALEGYAAVQTLLPLAE